jgi:hypothetical protein
MKYTLNDNIFEAFRLGIDPIPDWFMDKVTKNEAVLYKDAEHNTCAQLCSEGGVKYIVYHGDYIMSNFEGRVCGHTKDHIDECWTRIAEDEPVNAADPIDPEMERLKVLTDHYTLIAGEIKLVYDCFVEAGFRADEAFTLTMKLMETPVKPIERKPRADILREWNKQTAERKERLEK